MEPTRVEVALEALEALEHLGFKATRARALVDAALRAGVGGSAAAVLRAALRGS